MLSRVVTLSKESLSQVYSEVNADLTRFGERIEHEIEALGMECELNPPSLIQSDSWGKRVDEVGMCSRVSAF